MWPCRPRRQLLRVLFGENHSRAAARRGATHRSRGAPEWGSSDRLMPQPQRSPPCLLLWTVRAIFEVHPNKILYLKERVEWCGLHRIPRPAPASVLSFFFSLVFVVFFFFFLFLSFVLAVFLFCFFLVWCVCVCIVVRVFVAFFVYLHCFWQRKLDARSSLKRNLTPRDS